MADSFGVIFDVDGVLVDSYETHFQSWRQLGSEAGFEISADQFHASFGRTSREVLVEMWTAGPLSAEQVAQLDDRKETLYRNLLEEHFPTMPCAVELIDALAAEEVALAVGSSGPPPNVALTLESLQRHAAFAAVVTGADVTQGKPHPEVFLTAAERLALPTNRCIVIEDAAAGIKAAHAAGMKAVGLVSHGHTHDELGAADLLVDELSQLTPQTLRDLLN